jgi:predicted ATP-grasp superfamily ATP-dependent carboligase
VERASVLIAGFSGRALAQSARRAGFDPLVADAFGDEDTREAAASSRCVPLHAGGGFKGSALIAALDALAASSPTPPTGLVLGSGFESTPRLLETLAERFSLIANPPAVVERTKLPEDFFGTLQALGIRHPETQVQPPEASRGWLRKRIGGCGGLHITDCGGAGEQNSRHHYFQRKIAGEAISVLAAIGPASTAFAFSRQWTAPVSHQPYRYGGATGSVALEEDTEGRLIDASLAVAKAFDLRGLVSLDFLVDNGEPSLIEVNARPGATLDIFDDEKGTLFAAHIAAFEPGGDPAELMARQWRPAEARAAGYLYADTAPLTVPEIDWPEWTFDRPTRGSRIACHQPIATVVADARTPEVAESLCRQRLGLLSDMLYETPNGKGPN